MVVGDAPCRAVPCEREAAEVSNQRGESRERRGAIKQAMGSEVGQAIVNSVAAQAMEVDYGHVDVTGVSSGGIKPVDVHAAPLVSVNGGGQSVMMGVDKGVRTTSVGMIEPWSVEEDRE